MKYTWTAEQRARVVPGATVFVEGSPHYDDGTYAIVGRLEGFLLVFTEGANASVPWHRANPATLSP